MGAIQRRQGRWAESTANLVKATELNPNAAWPLQNLAYNYQMQRDFDSANKTIDRALKIDPDNFGLLVVRAKFAVAEKGDLSAWRHTLEAMEKLPPSAAKAETMVISRVGLLLFEKNFSEALRVSQSLPDDQLASKSGLICGKYLYIGIARHCMKDEAGARAALMHAKELAQTRVRETPDLADGHIQLGYVHAYLGEKAEAVAEAERAMQLLPESKDAFNGPDITEFAAKIFVAAGETDRAIDLITGLLKRPAALTVEMLKLDPEWDALRNDPRFQALIGKSPA
jgi:tetratricopeptide (TPR) repeat protein